MNIKKKMFHGTALSFTRIQVLLYLQQFFTLLDFLFMECPHPFLLSLVFLLEHGRMQLICLHSASCKSLAECLTGHEITNHQLSSHNPENRWTYGADMLQNGSRIITTRWKTKLPEVLGGWGGEFSKFRRSNFQSRPLLLPGAFCQHFSGYFSECFSFICWIWSLGTWDSVENVFQFSQ